jgi:hypothetical protein
MGNTTNEDKSYAVFSVCTDYYLGCDGLYDQESIWMTLDMAKNFKTNLQERKPDTILYIFKRID